MAIKTVILRISGGIGNQLFQYAYALATAQNIGKQVKLSIYSYYQNQFFLFGRKYSAKRNLRITDLLGSQHITSISDYKANFFLDLLLKIRFFRKKRFRLLYSQFTEKLVLDGYFQSELEFSISKSILFELQDLFRKTNPKKYNLLDRCAIHVRAGDLLNQPWNQLCDERYYADAIFYINSNFGITHFDIVTEDKLFANNLLSNINYVTLKTMPPSDEVSDFKTLTEYPYIICANSTFSWWASILARPIAFCSPEYFYTVGDKPNKLDNEVIIKYKKL
jgi:hypothetical protein